MRGRSSRGIAPTDDGALFDLPDLQHQSAVQQSAHVPSPKRTRSGTRCGRSRDFGPFCDTVKYTYDSLTSRWQRFPIRLRVAQEPFATGGTFNCFHTEELVDDKGRGVVESVAKVFVEAVEPQAAFDHCITQAMAEMHAQAFNRRCAQRGLDRSIAFLPTAVVVVPNGDAPFELATIEPYLPGRRRPDQADETAVAFSHFTFVNSEQLLVVCDVGVVGDFFTDPQIHTWDGQGFGVGNLGAEGIRLYLQKSLHVRNELTAKLGLPRLRSDSGHATILHANMSDVLQASFGTGDFEHV